jgi:4-hydroxy-tetrahydrodipicolinate reductase
MKIALLGYGKMGREVERIAIERGHTIAVRIDNENQWQTWLKNCQPNDSDNFSNFGNSEVFDDSQKVDVAIDFSTPQTAVQNIKRCFDLHIALVIGTTGWNANIAQLKERCLRENQALFHSSNFSIGVYLFIKAAKFLAEKMPQGYAPSITETHHIHKLDKPSGTALTLRTEAFGKATNTANAGSTDNNKGNIANNKTVNTTATIPPENVPIESIREGEINGIHTLKFISTEDEITITHKAHSRAGFALGAVKAAEFLTGKHGWFSMSDMFE